MVIAGEEEKKKEEESNNKDEQSKSMDVNIGFARAIHKLVPR